ncbi:hypothetical protein TRFO_31255 [Tritrichomonas foetus]|uniref:Exostosin GT47 domain-containing protein n=1 Tax=Tritrichomonas foetus TaxID=1144522 RepID=A0A1J4JW82_9EUKA|nr:hypothetical protein TRFO_31255 [Tritrichomonas foetus]|eukprot:OHT01782.1 hypothetical protein TRFO_31255 [Tritrichomonas foetus]
MNLRNDFQISFLFVLTIMSFSVDVSYPINVFQLPPKSMTDNLFIDSIKKCLNNQINKSYLPTNTADAEQHFSELNKEFSKYFDLKRPPYNTCSGPFLENEFIKRYKNKPLSYFSPFIPLFVPWFTIWKVSEHTYSKITDIILSKLKPDYLYFVLSESDFGFTGHDMRKLDKTFPNIFVFSASGMGHVAIPWLQCNYKPPSKNHNIKLNINLNDLNDQTNNYQLNKNIFNKEYFLSFCGNPRSSGERKETLQMTRSLLGPLFFEYRDDNWEEIVHKSLFVLSPRGIAVATYRTFEVIQMEAIPVIFTDHVHWLPYFPKLNWSKFSILTNVHEFPRTSLRLRFMRPFDIAEMKNELHRVNKEFFQWNGFFKQLDDFFSGKEHYFSCSKAFLTHP